MAAGQIDGNLGIVNQDGDSYFEHFLALKPHSGDFNATESMKFSLQHQNPLMDEKIIGGSAYDRKQFSMFSISDTNVLVWALKPAEEGIDNGIIMRAWNLSDKNKPVTITSNSVIIKAFSTSHIETDNKGIPVQKGAIHTTALHNRIQTFRIFLNQSLK